MQVLLYGEIHYDSNGRIINTDHLLNGYYNYYTDDGLDDSDDEVSALNNYSLTNYNNYMNYIKNRPVNNDQLFVRFRELPADIHVSIIQYGYLKEIYRLKPLCKYFNNSISWRTHWTPHIYSFPTNGGHRDAIIRFMMNNSNEINYCFSELKNFIMLYDYIPSNDVYYDMPDNCLFNFCVPKLITPPTRYVKEKLTDYSKMFNNVDAIIFKFLLHNHNPTRLKVDIAVSIAVISRNLRTHKFVLNYKIEEGAKDLKEFNDSFITVIDGCKNIYNVVLLMIPKLNIDIPTHISKFVKAFPRLLIIQDSTARWSRKNFNSEQWTK